MRDQNLWNGRDAAALVGAFTKDGIYCSPDTDPGINGEALATFVKGIWTAFPDFTVEPLKVGEIEAGVVALHWRVHGTNTGPGGYGGEPTGRSVSFQGASIVRLEGDKIRSDHAYFDRKGRMNNLHPSD
jgi:hypothetical protein